MAVYVVELVNPDKDAKPRLIETRQAATAIQHVAKEVFRARVVTTREAMALAKDGVEIENPDEPTEEQKAAAGVAEADMLTEAKRKKADG